MRKRLAFALAAEELAERSAAAFGMHLEDDAPGGNAVDRPTELVCRALLADLLELDDLQATIDAFPAIASNTLGMLFPLVLAGLQLETEDGEPFTGKVTLSLPGEAHATLCVQAAQMVALGLMLRQQGDVILPSTSAAQEYRPSHWGRPDVPPAE